MRGGEIPGVWPEVVSILSRTGPVSRQLPEFGPAGPSTRPQACFHEHPSAAGPQAATRYFLVGWLDLREELLRIYVFVTPGSAIAKCAGGPGRSGMTRAWRWVKGQS